MTKIKLCGLTRISEIEAANELRPEYVGFVFAKGSRRAVSAETAALLKNRLRAGIEAVGVFVDEDPETILRLLDDGIIDIVQLHGSEGEDDIRRLRSYTEKPLIKAFRITGARDVERALACSADYVLLDSGGGTGTAFDWHWIRPVKRPYFLAGGLDAACVGDAVARFHPYAVDVSSGIETAGAKDKNKMAAFVAAVRKEG